MDKRFLWQHKALKGSRLRLLIWGVLAAFLVVVEFRTAGFPQYGFKWTDRSPWVVPRWRAKL